VITFHGNKFDRSRYYVNNTTPNLLYGRCLKQILKHNYINLKTQQLYNRVLFKLEPCTICFHVLLTGPARRPTAPPPSEGSSAQVKQWLNADPRPTTSRVLPGLLPLAHSPPSTSPILRSHHVYERAAQNSPATCATRPKRAHPPPLQQYRLPQASCPKSRARTSERSSEEDGEARLGPASGRRIRGRGPGSGSRRGGRRPEEACDSREAGGHPLHQVPGVRADRARDLRAGRQEAAGASAVQEGTPPLFFRVPSGLNSTGSRAV
jgi:hypothetical protein